MVSATSAERHARESAASSADEDAITREAGLRDLIAVAGVSTAARLARTGAYEAALATLVGLPAAGSEARAVLDMRARIHAQQGDLPEAERAWTELLRIDPGNAAATAGLVRIRSQLAGGRRRSVWLAVFVALVAGGYLFAVLVSKRAFGELQQQLAESALRIADLRTTIDRLPTAIANAASLATGGRPSEARNVEPGPDLDIPQVTVRRNGEEWFLTFDHGLFSRGTDLTPEGRAVLARLGTKLRPHVGRLRLEVLGHSDDVPMPPRSRFADNEELQLARAVAAVSVLRAVSYFPADAVGAYAVGAASGIVPNDSSENRARNRSVIVRIIRRTG